MSARTIQQLQEAPSVAVAHKSALDTLNHKFTDAAHLGDIKCALDGASASQVALKRQLSESERALDSLITKTRIEAITQLENTRAFASQRESIEDDLAYLSHSLVSSLTPAGEDNGPTLLEDIETMHRTLKELENVRAYVAVVEHALVLSEAAVSQLRSSTSPISAASASQYATLQAFISDVTRACKAADDIGSSQGSLHIVSFLEKIREKTWADMKAILTTILLSASENINWPTAVDYLAASKDTRSKFELAFTDLLRLQEIARDKPVRQGEIVYAIMLSVCLQMPYVQPEWYFTHIINVAHDHKPFMESPIQRLLTGTKFQGVNAWHQYVTLLLGILERKIKRSVPQLLGHPALLAHTIYQSLVFDTSVRDLGYEFEQVEGKNEEEAEKGGLSRIILDQKEWFDAWIEGEKKFADDQYHEIISASDAWIIADDDLSNHEGHHRLHESDVKATNSARRVKALVEQITDRYMPLPSFRQRTQFLIRVQVPVLESYHSRISSSLDAFETLSSALVRAVPGALGVDVAKTDSKRLTGGVEGSQRLCKALLSARYIEHAMKTWGEEVCPDTQEAPEGTIFEELITQYAELSSRAEDLLIQQTCGECEASLKSHFASLVSASDGAEGTTHDMMVPSTLFPSVALLSSHLTFLRTALPSSIVTHLYRRIASRIAEHVLQREVLFRPGLSRTSGGRHILAPRQALSIQAECELWAETCQVALNTSRSRAEKPWSRLLAAGRLLSPEMQGSEQLFQVLLNQRRGEGTGENEDEWEATMDSVTRLGSGGLTRDEVTTILRLRG
ncbi:hypothetical protein ID866_7919 [Astraeus odoratus]|nr:hypothetical protein ID866_7919 [Astraeus odoratus]